MRPYSEAEAIEDYLGDPLVPGNPLSASRSRELDDADASREPFMRILWEWGFAPHYVPASYGGKLRDASLALAFLRCIGRRDITTAHQLGNNLLGSLPVWAGGSLEQRTRLAQRLLHGQRAAFALTERGHGADVLANETTAEPAEGGVRLNGEKWLISQGATSDVLTVMARTGTAGDPRGFTMFLVEKDSLASGSFTALPREATMGFRGADISGIRFQDCFVPENARVGQPGTALDLTLKGLSVCKIFVSGLSLAATDTCLRTVLAFALDRKLYGNSVAAIPHARTALATNFADLMLADCCATFGTRAVSVIPSQMSVLGNVVKVAVPRICDRSQRELAGILGARFYLRHGHHHGIFEKMMRDQAIISVFDGNSIVCLNAIAAQLDPLLALGSSRSEGACNAAAARISRVGNLAIAPSNVEFDAVTLHNRGVDDLVQSLPETLLRLEKSGADGLLLEIGRDCLQSIRALPSRLEALRRELGETSRSAEMYEVAEDYALLACACAGFHLWELNRHWLGDFFARGAWLRLALERLFNRKYGDLRDRRHAVEDVFEELVRRFESSQMFGVVPMQLAARESRGAYTAV